MASQVTIFVIVSDLPVGNVLVHMVLDIITVVSYSQSVGVVHSLPVQRYSRVCSTSDRTKRIQKRMLSDGKAVRTYP